VETAKSGDFVYFDPPYIPVDATSNFTSYTSAGFDTDSQRRLAATMSELKERGTRALLSNSDTPLSREIYKEFNLVSIQAPRMVSAKTSGRGQINELLVLNY
jgi:DNA adenine methylase